MCTQHWVIIVFVRRRQCALHVTCFLGPTRVHKRNGISIGSVIFAVEFHRALGMSLPLKITPSHGALWTPSNPRFLGPTRLHNPNGISIGSDLFCTAHDWRQTDQPTNRPSHIYVCSTAMWPKNGTTGILAGLWLDAIQRGQIMVRPGKNGMGGNPISPMSILIACWN